MTTPTVFISYSHDSPEHADRVLDLSNRLRADGIDCILDQYESSPPEGWPRWMDKHIRRADFVLMICTETYFRRVIGEEKPGTGLGVKWEGNLIYQHIYNADTKNTRFIPVLFTEGRKEHIPTPLQGATRYSIDTPVGYEDLYRRITNQPSITKPKLGKLRELPPRERRTDYLGIRISTAKLPSTHPDLFGRGKELAALDRAWEDPHTNVLSLVAWGGVGKTALVNKWLSQFARDNYRGAESVYVWSFYRQGAAEGRQVSADQFIAAALTWFGDPDPTHGSPWDKGGRLAELVKKQRTLLILDGLEPLQNTPPTEKPGEIKDRGLCSLLRELARQNPGLVIVTTRLTVDDLKDFKGSTGIEIDLGNLSPEAGAAYLAHLGVNGTTDKLERASEEFGGHALALTLLGSYLTTVYHGDVRQRDKIARLTDDKKQGAHARRV
ncbi:MAG: TIR domain-containing protein, partial [Dehalococcoidia bacterium]|nr:TIR domain-containing protein [Dehalococcoidia bacterium]